MSNNESFEKFIDAWRKNLEESTITIKGEREKAEKESSSRIFEALKIIAAFVVAMAAILSFILNTCTFTENVTRKDRDKFYSLLKDLGAESSTVRSSAAFSIANYIDDKIFGERAIKGLALQLGVEEDFLVQRVMAETLVRTEKSVPHLLNLKNLLSSEIIPLLDEEGRLRLGQNKSEETLERLHRTVKLIKTKQNALVTVVFAYKTIICNADGESTKKCLPDFSGLPLKGFKFMGFKSDLQGALFKKTMLWKADFFGCNLESADFTQAQLMSADFRKTNLTHAVFDNAEMKKPREIRAHRSLFKGSNLNGASFRGAKLGGTDFEGSLNLTASQLKEAAFQGACLDENIRKKLNAKKVKDCIK